MLTDRQRLILARTRLAVVRAEIRRKVQRDDRVDGFMETRGWTNADLDRMLCSEKVLRGLERDLNAPSEGGG